VVGGGRTSGSQGASTGTSEAITSSGSSRCVAPGFSCSATLNALRTASAVIPGSDRRAFHFVIGPMRLTTSMY
jgi:hypothetical protein